MSRACKRSPGYFLNFCVLGQVNVACYIISTILNSRTYLCVLLASHWYGFHGTYMYIYFKNPCPSLSIFNYTVHYSTSTAQLVELHVHVHVQCSHLHIVVMFDTSLSLCVCVCVCENMLIQLLDEVEELRIGASQEKKQRVRLERQLRELEEEMMLLKVVCT